jgi:predicted MPP superfamily phosphohydrolase
MRILVVQISDIHLKTPGGAVGDRAAKVAQAVVAKAPRVDACYLVLTGDVANSGEPAQYSAARQLIERIKEELLEARIASVNVVAIPGNHDLNLATETDTRGFLLDSHDKYLATKVDFEGSAFESIISVQDEFFQFESDVSGLPPLANKEKLYYRRSFRVGDRTVVFHCFNTAWLSRRHEQQAKLFLPPQIYDYQTPAETDLSIAIFHHPYNWLDANNQKLLRSFVEAQSDIVLTGHEHDADVARFVSVMGQNLDYFRAPAFSDPKAERNGFQCLIVDFDKREQDITIFNWEGNRFEEAENATWLLQRNANRGADPLSPKTEFQSYLQDVGTAFRHPRCIEPQCSLRLRDLYVYPELKHREIEKILKGKKTQKPPVQGKALPDFLSIHPKVVVFGADDCGKTSFLKVLYEDLSAKGLLPLMLKGEDLRKVRDDRTLVTALSRAVMLQYASGSAAPYLQADRDKRILLIDDLHRSRLSKDGQIRLVDSARDRFERIVIVVPDFMEIQDMFSQAATDPFFGFERCTIKEFGHFHRQKLIENWLKVGSDGLDEGAESIDKRIKQIDKTIATLLGKNVLPHHPFTILSLLQLMESKDTPATANGSYGYLFDMLLKQALATVNTKDVDEKITYLSGIGYAMFKKKRPELNEEEIRAEHDAYCDRFDMVRDFTKMMADLLRAEVLVEEGNVYRFKYPFELYYSAAKYFQINAGALRSELFFISDHIYGERNANVLIFYVYLTKDDSLIGHIIENAKRIFGNYKECDMEGDVEFMNQLSSATPAPLELEIGDAGDRRDEFNKKRDAAKERNEPLDLEDDEVIYNDQLQILTKILIAIKTLQILGQILRNFTASLEGPLKLDMTRECYSLGLRTITAILSCCQNDIPALRRYFGSLISERTGITDPKKLASRIEEVIVWMGTASAAGMVKRVSYAAGHVDLTRTYRRVLESDERLSIRIIDAAIRLDHFQHPPEDELDELSKRVRKNGFAFTVIRELVGEYIYFFGRHFPALQRIGAQWGIAVSTPSLLGNRSKK